MSDQLSAQRTTIGSRFDARETVGFDYLRLSLALAVILWHSAKLTKYADTEQGRWLWLAVRPILPLFFALSGFLVASSLDRLRKLKPFLILRGLRIFPALCVEVILSALLLGPIVTTVPWSEYFSSSQFFWYFANIVGYVHYDLPGVFRDHAITQVNASLWTVPYELECYIALAVTFLFGLFKRSWTLFGVTVVVVLACFLTTRGYDYDVRPLVPGRLLVAFFLAGALVFKLRYVLPASGWIGFGLLALSYLLVAFVPTTFLSPIVVGYAAAALGCSLPPRIPVIFDGDYSYGMYLYAFPIQQIWISMLPGRSMWVNFALAVVSTAAFAAFSWHAIEKPTLSLKKRLVPKSR